MHTTVECIQWCGDCFWFDVGRLALLVQGGRTLGSMAPTTSAMLVEIVNGRMKGWCDPQGGQDDDQRWNETLQLDPQDHRG